MEYPRFGLNGQVALVTGAARGLGRAISLALAHAGADVALGLRDVNADAGLGEEIRKTGRRVLALQMDVNKMEHVLMEEGLKKFADPQKALLALIAEKRRALQPAGAL